MCGIYLTLSTEGHILPNQRTCELLRRRGPDSVRELKRTRLLARHGINHKVFITCYSTVLALRGDRIVAQPVTKPSHACPEESQDFLCWNGEAWKLSNEPVAGNDSEAVFSLLSQPSSTLPNQNVSKPSIADYMSAVQGPYAFAYYQDMDQRISFGRDPLGRRSLMFRFDDCGTFHLTSVADVNESGWQEVEPDGLYSIYLLDFLDNSNRSFAAHESIVLLQKTDYRSEFHVQAVKSQIRDSAQSTTEPPMLSQTAESTLCQPLCTSSGSVHILEQLMSKSLQSRVGTIPRRYHNIESPDPAAALAVLFSGGLDCTVLARMADDVLSKNEPIDLLNVAFENPRVHKRPKDSSDVEDYSPYELCPDRVTGRSSFAELQNVCPHREWRFVAIDVPYEETLAHRPEVVALIHPHNTEMDLSIACALYFAARGSGFLTKSHSTQAPIPYTTEARVLLSGLGADELFAGYQRHEVAFSRNGSQGLLDELNLDVGRLGKRNLGRDDRVLSNWARETRFPFLDEEVVNWAINTPVSERCDFGALPIDSSDDVFNESALLEPGKKVLRCLAWKLGMKNVASEKKRAIQFGARTAKMETGRSKGTQLLA